MNPYNFIQYTKYNWFYLVKNSKIGISKRNVSVSVLGKSGKGKG